MGKRAKPAFLVPDAMGVDSQIIEASQFRICSLGGFREAECRDGLLKHSGQELQGTIVQYSSTRALRTCVSIGSVSRLSVASFG